jgi:hypothetical protein
MKICLVEELRRSEIEVRADPVGVVMSLPL